MKKLVYSVKVRMRDALLVHILDVAGHIRNSQRKLQRATHGVHNQVAACVLPAVAFSKTSFKHRSVQIKGNFTKLMLHLYFKCIIYYAGVLFCSVYGQ
jgi:hypothetical protein